MNTKVETKLCAEISQREDDSSICARLKGGYKVSGQIITPDPLVEPSPNPPQPIPDGAVEGTFNSGDLGQGVNMGNCGKTTVEWALTGGVTNPGADIPGQSGSPASGGAEWTYIYFDKSNDGVADDTYDDIYASNFIPVDQVNAQEGFSLVPGLAGLSYINPLQATDKIKISHEFTPVAGGPTIIAAFGDLYGQNENLDKNNELSTNFIGLKGGSADVSYEVKVRNLNNWQAKLKANANLLTGNDVCEVLYERGNRNDDKEKLTLKACVESGVGSSSVGETEVGVTFNVLTGSPAGYSLAYSDEEVDLYLTYAGSAYLEDAGGNVSGSDDGSVGDAQPGDVSKRLTGHIKYTLDECSKVGLELDSQKLEVCYYRDIELTA
jgi:hypothetical protein